MRDRKQTYHATFMLTIILIIFMFFSAGCKEDTPVQTKEAASITVDDVSCTEAWINIKTENITLPVTGTLTAEGVNKQITLNKADTVVYVDSLLPNKSYSLSFMVNSTTAKGEAKTMDTTSHSFTWQSFEFGEELASAGSKIYDIAIIDENNIWAVGEIYTEDTYTYDSLGNWIEPYNAIHWDGEKWELLRIQFYTFCGQPYTGSYPAQSILAFNENSIWISSNSQITHLNGTQQLSTECLPISVLKLWGNSDNNVYAVGINGGIAHYNGTSWTKIESGTTMNLTNAAYDNADGNIYIAGWNASNFNGIILKGKGNEFSIFAEGRSINEYQLFNPYLPGTITSCWIDEKGRLYTGGGFLLKYYNNIWNFDKKLEGNYLWQNTSAQHFGFITDIKGKAANDIYFTGERNTIRYFNGVRWQQICEPYNPDSDKLWSSMDIKDNIIALCGFEGRKGIIKIIKTN